MISNTLGRKTDTETVAYTTQNSSLFLPDLIKCYGFCRLSCIDTFKKNPSIERMTVEMSCFCDCLAQNSLDSSLHSFSIAYGYKKNQQQRNEQ
jgi:hypothetical protein